MTVRKASSGPNVTAGRIKIAPGYAVRTASSEQVRQPIFREGTEAWKPFEPWLESLKTALGDVLEAYPAAPAAL